MLSSFRIIIIINLEVLCRGAEAGGAIGQPQALELLKISNGTTTANQGPGGGGASRVGASGGGGDGAARGQGYGGEPLLPTLVPLHPHFSCIYPPLLPSLPPSLPATMEEVGVVAMQDLLIPSHLGQSLPVMQPDLEGLLSHPTPRMYVCMYVLLLFQVFHYCAVIVVASLKITSLPVSSPLYVCIILAGVYLYEN